MTTQRKQEQAIFPDLPRQTPAIDGTGYFLPLWSLAFSNLFQALQTNFKREGFRFPPLTDTQLAEIEALYAPYIGQAYETMLQFLPDISGQNIFDSVARVPKVFVITFDGGGIVTAASWKTYTIT